MGEDHSSIDVRRLLQRTPVAAENDRDGPLTTWRVNDPHSHSRPRCLSLNGRHECTRGRIGVPPHPKRAEQYFPLLIGQIAKAFQCVPTSTHGLAGRRFSRRPTFYVALMASAGTAAKPGMVGRAGLEPVSTTIAFALNRRVLPSVRPPMTIGHSGARHPVRAM